MSLNSIRDSYSRLLTAFKDAGVSLSESQKSDLDTFVLAIESSMSRQREQAVRRTRRLVESKLESQYKKAFEQVMESVRENTALAAKIQDKVTKINESKKIAKHVDGFLDLYVESVLPKKAIVDYDRMQRLERLHESLRSTLVADDDAVKDKIRQLEESYRLKASKCETAVAKARAELNESMKKARDMKAKLDRLQAAELLESKTKDLPTYEARRVRKQLKEATAPEIEKKFDQTLKGVRDGMPGAQDEKTVQSEIEKILESDAEEEAANENDMLRGRKHNAHVDVPEAEKPDEDLGEAEPDVVDEEEFETMETVREGADGEVELDESDVIDSSLMKIWCRQSVEVR